MTSTTRIPSIFSSYLSAPPPTSLLLLTSVLGASTNWLLLHFLLAIFSPGLVSGIEGNEEPGTNKSEAKVVFVSFLRDWDFWREGSKRVGLDLVKLLEKQNLAFLDGLSALFHQDDRDQDSTRRGLRGKSKRSVLTDSSIESLEKSIFTAINSLKEENQNSKRIVLVLDGLDLLLASTATDAEMMMDLLAELREHVHSTIVTCAADSALTQSTTTPLEVNHIAFIAGLAHQARLVMGLRLLDTGTAKDVSGVIRVTRGPQGDDLEEKELLYFVGGNGEVKVFERGA